MYHNVCPICMQFFNRFTRLDHFFTCFYPFYFLFPHFCFLLPLCPAFTCFPRYTQFIVFYWFSPIFTCVNPFSAVSSVFICIGDTIRTCQEIKCLPYAGFSLTRPSGLGWSYSCHVRVYICVSQNW